MISVWINSKHIATNGAKMDAFFGFVLVVVWMQCSGGPCQGQGASATLVQEPQEFSHWQETVPSVYYRHHGDTLYYTTQTQDGHVGELTVALSAFGQKFTIDLVLNSELLSGEYVEKRLHHSGTHINKPTSQDLKSKACFYHGILRGLPDSYAAISTCHGVSGVFSNGRDTYHIQPIQPSLSSLHRVYRDSDRKAPHSLCGVGSDHQKNVSSLHETLRVKRATHVPATSNFTTRYIEIYLVTDFRLSTKLGNADVIYHRCKEIINVVSRLYRQLNIYVVLVGAEIWASGDQTTVTENPDSTLTNFLHYRRQRINPYHRNDNAQLLSGITFTGGVVGKACTGPICTFQFSGGVNMDNSDLFGPVATTVAHELGHNLGMQHDNVTCFCPDDKCVMAATTGGAHPIHWSSCSVTSLNDAFSHGMDYCLKDAPPSIFQGPVCGNGFTEEGEECDCGLACDNSCCNATTCRRRTGAACAAGKCCDLNTCQIKSIGSECRSSRGQCDLPEYCDGDTEFCPLDHYKHDGTLCDNNKAYCYKGICPSRDAQCRMLWGKTGRTSEDICYTQLNTKITHNGNCGYSWVHLNYTPCATADVMCGMLHCIHLNEKLKFWKDQYTRALPASFIETTASRSHNRKYICRGAILDVGLDMPDPGMVPDGARCGDERVCLNHHCTHISIIRDPKFTNVNKTAACLRNCSNNGVCNSQGNCHCDRGWAPPNCDVRGKGGSVDSHSANQPYVPSNDSITTGLLVFFLLVVPLVAVAMFCGYRNRTVISHWWSKQPSLKYRFSSLRKTSLSLPPPPKPPPPHSPVTRVHSVRFGPPPDISNPVLQSSTDRQSTMYISYAEEFGQNSPIKSRTPKVPDGHPSQCIPLSQEVNNANCQYKSDTRGMYVNVTPRPPARPPPPRPKSSYDPEPPAAVPNRNSATRSSSLRSPTATMSGEVTVHSNGVEPVSDTKTGNNIKTIEDYRQEIKSRTQKGRNSIVSNTPTDLTQSNTDNNLNKPIKPKYNPMSPIVKAGAKPDVLKTKPVISATNSARDVKKPESDNKNNMETELKMIFNKRNNLPSSGDLKLSQSPANGSIPSKPFKPNDRGDYKPDGKPDNTEISEKNTTDITKKSSDPIAKPPRANMRDKGSVVPSVALRYKPKAQTTDTTSNPTKPTLTKTQSGSKPQPLPKPKFVV